MIDGQIDLISMADIARLAGQSRATVGNWKARNAEEFPAERGRGARGPLYDRAEVTAWLEATDRLAKRSSEVTVLWDIANQFRGTVATEDVLPLVLLLLAVMSKVPAAWERLHQVPEGQLEDELRQVLSEHFPHAVQLLPAASLPSRLLGASIHTLSHVERGQVAALADAALEQSAKALGKHGGEFLSPPSVRKLVVSLAEPTGTIYNPATGAAQLLVDAANSSSQEPLRLVGQEINPRIWAISQLNLALHDLDADVALGDVFTEDRHRHLRADCVVSVPPWNHRFADADLLHDDPRWIWGEPGPRDSNAAWIQHCLARLADDGRAVIVLPNGALFEGGRSGRIRHRILRSGLLDCVIALPAGVFPRTPIPCAVFVFRKGRKSGGTPAPVLMVDLTASGEIAERGVSSLSDGVIAEATALYSAWLAGKAPDKGFAAVATYEDLVAHDFVIDPGRYLSLPSVSVVDRTAAEKLHRALVERLDELTQQSNSTDAELRDILERHR
jgi:type I restriction-modification system DNA methylase subunit/predicted DNA-binding transcriptional regulator AlpA